MLFGRVLNCGIVHIYPKEDIMKMNKIVFAAVVVMVVALVSCSSGGGGDGVPGVPGDAEDVSALTAPAGNFPLHESEAKSLLNWALSNSSFVSLLSAAETQIYDDAFRAKYGSYLTWELGVLGLTSTSVEVDLNAARTQFPAFANTPALQATADSLTVTIEGYSEMTFSSNKPIATYNDWSTRTNGDWYERSYDNELEIKISDSKLDTIGKVTGFIYYLDSGNSKQTLVARGDSNTEDKFDGEGEGSTEVSFALSISDGVKGAKYLFSGVYERKSSVREIDGKDGFALSSVRVYDSTNALRYTIQDASEYGYFSAIANALGSSYGVW
jgi:hypothetical protein